MKFLTITISIILSSISFSMNLDSLKSSKDWVFKSAVSVAPGFLTEKTKSIQLQGSVGFIQNKIEFRGDVFYFLNSFGDRPRFTKNHQLYAGVFYKFLANNFQPYIGFQPGITMAQSSEFGTFNTNTQTLDYKTSYDPVGSLSGGFDLFGKKWLYITSEVRYIFGKHKSHTYPVYLDEFRISFGFGFTL